LLWALKTTNVIIHLRHTKGENWNKEPHSVWIVFKICFSKFWEITMGTLYIKKFVKILNKLLYFHENSLCFKNHFICLKNFKKSTRTCDFFCFKNNFSLSNVHQIISIVLQTLIYSTRRDPCVKNIQKKYTFTFLDFDVTSLSTIIVLNLWPWFKIKL
jgi:hypothetical protein